MLAILNPEFPTWEVLRIMLLVAGSIVVFLIAATLMLTILTYIVRLVFIPRTRWNIYKNGVDEFEKFGFDVKYKR